MKCKIVINTTKRFSNHTLPRVLESLNISGFKDNEIIIMNGGHDKRSRKFFHKNHLKLPFDALDYTALIELGSGEYRDEHYFVMHDTVKVGKNFREILWSIDPSKWDVVALKNKPSMNIGMYRAGYLRQKNDLLIGLKNSDYSSSNMQAIKSWGVDNEDYFGWGQNDVVITSYADLLSCPLNGDPIIVDEYDYYSNGVLRRIEYYEFLDLYKIKSNWVVKGEYEMGL